MTEKVCYNPAMIRLKRLYAHNFKQLQEVELYFPDSARILVQGKNEAGKSTLFEAVFFALFGTALATETGARGLDALIAYGTEKARVELDVACDGRLFKITRTIVRDKSNAWELEIARDDAPPEEIRGNTAVNKRLIAELGFDGEALLNTCFVEQKKLEKLEGLSKAKREESLAKLLNLDAVVDLENDLKVRAEDKQELERLKKRAELADIQTELPDRERALASVDTKLKMVDLRRAVEGAATEMQTVQTLDAAICELCSQRDAMAARVERIDILKDAMLSVKQARDTLERIDENARQLEQLQTDRAEARRAVEAGSNVQPRLDALRRLARTMQRLGQISAALDTNHRRAAQLKAQLVATQARLDELTGTARREQELLEQIQARLHARQSITALTDWIQARRAIAGQDEIAHAVEEKQAARDSLSHTFRVQVYGLAALLLVLVLAAALVAPLAGLLIALAAVVLIVLAVRMTLLWRDLDRAAEELGQAQGEARARASEDETRQARVAETAARLAQLNVEIPSPETAQTHIAALEQSTGAQSEEQLRAEQEAARERLLHARALLGELGQSGTSGETGQDLKQEIARCDRAVAKAQRVLARWQPRVDGSAVDLEVESNPEAIQRACYQIEAQQEQVQRRRADIARLDQEIVRREQQAQVLLVQAREAYERARAALPHAREWDARFETGDYNTFGKELRNEYDALGGDAAVKRSRELEGELGRREGERNTRARNAEVLCAQTQELFAALGQAQVLSDPPQLEELQALRERFTSIDLGDEATLRSQSRELVGRLHSLRDRMAQLERELGLAEEELDPAACHAEYDEKARALLVRERGVEIVSLARRRIVRQVLPATMDYMRQILPTLTRDRYHDAQLDPESYKIQVWDERAGNGGAFKEKNIFSGGTKDQFSLALRLAFALATLPQERGTAPSFIFLDEPLGSFDTERAEALIYLLTEGEIARAFDQIFLISHVHVDERLFTHRVILENGKVQFTDLPGPTP